MSSAPVHDFEFSRANSVRRWTLIGFALGMLVGLLWVGFAPPAGDELVSMARWRNTILIGIGLGFLFGLLRPAPRSTPGKEESGDA